jgi:Zn finger protein HypA/HybF involved in hydrogenase expression
MPVSEIRSIFEPVIAIITSLVQMQSKISSKNGAAKIVYLVVGLGESACLRDSLLKKWFRTAPR